MRLQSQEGENEKQSLRTRCEQLAKEKKELEQRTSALQLSVNQFFSVTMKRLQERFPRYYWRALILPVMLKIISFLLV